MTERIRLVRPVAYLENYGPTYTRKRGDRNYDFAWAAGDAQGMPNGPGGAKVHGGVDMFADGGDPVLSPVTGRVVRAVTGGGVVGQVFGGIIAVEAVEGHAVQMRHVNPTVPVGAPVAAGDQIATVTAWQSGWPHAHVEVYKDWPSPYDFRYTIDPRTVEWIDKPDPVRTADYFFEELPHTEGGRGPAVVWHGKGSTAAAQAIHKARGRITSTVRDGDGVGYVLWWLPGTHAGGFPIFGGWVNGGDREVNAERRETNTGRVMRRFRGRHRSLYPIPAV